MHGFIMAVEEVLNTFLYKLSWIITAKEWIDLNFWQNVVQENSLIRRDKPAQIKVQINLASN